MIIKTQKNEKDIFENFISLFIKATHTQIYVVFYAALSLKNSIESKPQNQRTPSVC